MVNKDKDGIENLREKVVLEGLEESEGKGET